MARANLVFILAVASFASVSAILLDVPGFATLNGTEEQSWHAGRPYYAFRSVHYAEKPTAATRFLPPVPKAPYPQGTIVDATKHNGGCTQKGGIGDEDCLTVNVFTPADSAGRSLPVMVWIHGGAFSLGQAVEYVPFRYMDYDMIVVAIQYRLGPLGFLCFDTDDVPGNAAIFDQIEALRWVNKNIRAFGGDPNQITIAGESAGSASVSLLLLAPQARGLFQRAIGESGSVLAEWALDSGDRGKVASIRVAELAGCPIDNEANMIQCVRTIDQDILTEAYFQYSDDDMLHGGLGFSASNPVIQKAGAQRIIEVPPRELLDSGNYNQVPTMWGANKQEGTLVLAILYGSYLLPNDLVNNATYLQNDAIPDILKALHIEDTNGQLAQELTDKYMVGADMGDFTSMTPGLTDLCSVLFLKDPTYENAQRCSDRNPETYYYSFDYLGRHSMFQYFFAQSKPPIPHGVSHADELIYLWYYPFPGEGGLRQFNASETILSDKMVQVWSNFVIHGKPTPAEVQLLPGIPQHPPYSRANENFMSIDENWSVKRDYTLTYTVTVDELREAKVKQHLRSHPARRHPIQSAYLPKPRAML